LWQAWALYEQKCNHIDRARELFQKALDLEHNNPYVCHASGLMERKLGNLKLAKELWERALQKKSTAALVCSLGELLISNRQYAKARELYLQHLLKLESGRERTEVYLAAAWLEEKYVRDVDRAEELIRLALLQSPGESRAHVALARLEGRRNSGEDASRRRLANACMSMEHENAVEPTDGRLYNAWAHLEVKSRRLRAARKILLKGMKKFPNDQSVSTQATLDGYVWS
jgi:tetratricopeptide (TPR) repeat protein